MFLRFRTRRGFGVHSPFAFRFITQVIGDKQTYQVCEELRQIRLQMMQSPAAKADILHRDVDSRTAELLFRLVRFFHPASILHIGQTSGLSLLYLIEADDKADCTAVADAETLQNISLPQAESDKLSKMKKIGYDEFLSDKSESIGFAFLNFAFAEIAKNEAALDKCIKEAEEHSVVVITDIHANPKMKQIWDHRTDLVNVYCYKYGLIHFLYNEYSDQGQIFSKQMKPHFLSVQKTRICF